MKSTVLIILGLVCLACSGGKTEATASESDTTVIMTDTVVHEDNAHVTSTPMTLYDSAGDGTLVEEKGETVYVSPNQYSFISDPYDFPLDTGAIKGLLGEDVQMKVIETEAGDDYSAYSYYTVNFKDTEISFYSYSGKHFSSITTPLLPLKKGIKIGMKKAEFQTAMAFEGANPSKANVYRLADDYGHMDFSFQADTLYWIYAYYEEGD